MIGLLEQLENNKLNKPKKRKNICVLPNHPATSSIHHKAIFAAAVLDFCVRDGNRYDHCAVITGSFKETFPEN